MSLPECAPEWVKDAIAVGKVTPVQSNVDIDWRVEQKLARVLAERNLYWKGIFDGVLLGLFCIYLIWTYAPTIKELFREK